MNGSTCSEGPKPGEEMTPEEREILHRLSSKAQRYQTAADAKKGGKKNPEQAALTGEEEEEEVSHQDVYAANLSLLRN
jgi:hypothetical protein